ncbi:LPXTG cell wall anchor domain-containing protein [Glycomyces sp. A-F 0318]|uniref:LPXTG cell wall anchor domain-containing protein n=1 Tax=Glycomyces amatae TaxID=2881355 RepID=UPI001E4D772F|nr:LPXTG cell wall anchor domain-containing protein [Glycomyces amatae]
MHIKQSLKRLAALLGAAAVGTAAAAAVAVPAQAEDSHRSGARTWFSVTTDVWGEAECKSGEWHVTWYLEDTSETDRSYDHNVISVGYQTEGDKQWQWHGPDFESGATLAAAAEVPANGEGALSGTQVLPGDTEWVRLAAPTLAITTSGFPALSATLGFSDKLLLGECTLEPSAATVTSSCTEFTVLLEVPQNGRTTEFAVATAAGEETHTLAPGESTTVTVPIDYDRGSEDPRLEVTWPDGSSELVLDDYGTACVGLAEVAVVADCIEFKVVLSVPENGLTTEFTVATAAGEETHTLAPGDAPLELFPLVAYDGQTEPWLEVTWPEGSVPFAFEDYDAQCIAYSDLTGTLWSECDSVGYEFLNTAVQNGGVPFDVRLEPSTGDAVPLTIEPEAHVEGAVPVAGDGEFSVDVYIDDELEDTFVWEYDAAACDGTPPPTGEESTPVAQEQLPTTGSSLTVAVVAAAALAAAGAAVYIVMRRRRTAGTW